MVMMETSDRDFGASGTSTTEFPSGFNYNTVSANEGKGPFDAKVWDYIGSMDAWGLPKVQCYATTLVGGKPAMALNIGGEWHCWQVNSVQRIKWIFDKMRSLYSWTNIA